METKWDLVKIFFCDEEGWVRNEWVAHGVSVGISYEGAGFNSDQISIKQYNSSDSSWRLRTIYSILTNNGWTRIEPDGSNLIEGKFEFLIAEDYITDQKYKEILIVNASLIKNKDMAWHVFVK